MATTDTGPEPGPDASAAPAAEDSSTPAPEVSASSGAWAAGVDHKTVGRWFLLVALLFLVAGGVLALIMRSQLAAPDLGIATGDNYRQLFTLHGVFMVFLFLMPAWVGVATVLVPLQVGAARLAFPRVQAMALWLVVAGGAMMVAAPFVSDVISGWTLSAPLPEGRGFRGEGPDLLILGLGLVLVAVVAATVNLMVTILKLRAPGLTLKRAPLFSWSVLISGSVLLLALPVLVGALLMLFVDRQYGGRMFNGFTGGGGGNPVLWPRLFWFAAYPTLWALLLPALGAVAEIVPVFGRQRTVGRHRVMAAMAAVGVLCFFGWGGEVASLRRARPLFALGALAVLVPAASVLMGWLLTLAAARKAHRGTGVRAALGSEVAALGRPAVVHALGFASVLALGLAGAAVAAIDAGGGLHRNYWSVAYQHTLFFGASTLGLVTALYYWAPKLWGRHLSARLGTFQGLTMVAGLHLTFIPMYVLGIQDMRVHLASYPSDEGWQAANVVATAGAFLLGLSVLLLVANVAAGAVSGRRAEADPWGGHTLEWASPSPPPPHNFDSLPDVRSDTPVLDLRAASEPLVEVGG